MKIVWAAEAVDDLEAIWEHVAEDSPTRARKLIQQLVEAPDALESFPRMGCSVPEDDTGTARELIVGSYRILYEVGAERVDIFAVVHASRDLSMGLPPWGRLR